MRPSAIQRGRLCSPARRTIPNTRAHTRASRLPGGLSSRVSSAHPKIDFTIPSLTGLGDRHYDRAKDLEYEVSNARIWGGIHFRSAVEDGVEIGKKTAHHVLAHHFHESND